VFSKMKKSVFISSIVSVALASVSSATINWQVSLIAPRNSSGVQVPDDTLWAITYQNSLGNLPGGLENNSSLTVSDATAAASAFGGRTITTGQNISGSTILFTGRVLDGEAGLTFSGAIPSGVVSGGIWGLYWFPGLVGTTLPTSNFQIGGFTQVDNIAVPNGDIGTVIPIDGTTVTTAFFDNVSSGVATDLPVSRFTAIVAIPEPASFALSALGVLALLRRRRN
jgi:PEP-CTERM motif